MAYKDKEKAKEYNRQWYIRTRKNNPEFKKWKKEYDKNFHQDYQNPNLTPERAAEYTKRYKEKNLEKVLAKDREYKKLHKIKYAKQNRLWREKNPDKLKEYAKKYKESGQQSWHHIKCRYGLTKQEFEQILASQNNLCPICGQGFENRKKCIDHCHKTDKIRGIIHRECNLILGFAEDKIEILNNAVKYLNKNYEQTVIQPSKEGVS